MTLALMLAALMTQAAPGDPAALSDAATQMSMQKRYAEAEKLWQRALAADEKYFPAAFNLGFMFYSRSMFDKAEPYLRTAARLQPNDFNSRYLLGSALVNHGQREAALREWREAVRINPKHVKLLEVMAVEYGKGHYFREAVEAARNALALSEFDLNAYLVAVKACQDALDPAATEIAKRAAEMFPKSARANFEYGFQLQRAGRPEQAMPYIKKAMELDPSYEEPYFFYGEQLARNDQHEAAVVNLREALKIRSDYVPAAMLLAKSLMSLGRYDEARQELERCIDVSPNHPQPHLVLSQIYFRLGEEEKARQEKEVSLRLRRANPGLMEAPQAIPFPAQASSRR